MTRDRREGITDMFGLPVRLVDTAGFEGSKKLDEVDLARRKMNKQMV